MKFWDDNRNEYTSMEKARVRYCDEHFGKNDCGISAISCVSCARCADFCEKNSRVALETMGYTINPYTDNVRCEMFEHFYSMSKVDNKRFMRYLWCTRHIIDALEEAITIANMEDRCDDLPVLERDIKHERNLLEVMNYIYSTQF